MESREQLVPLAISQSLPPSGHRPPGAEQRIELPAPVSQALLLDPTPDVVDHRVGQLDPVETIDGDRRVGEIGEDPFQVATVWIDGHRVDALAPWP